MRTFTFVKGRELESLGFFHLTKFNKWPAFADYIPESRVSGNGHKPLESRFHD
jgi:hypothetical protein